jgi:hypothetical protein
MGSKIKRVFIWAGCRPLPAESDAAVATYPRYKFAPCVEMPPRRPAPRSSVGVNRRRTMSIEKEGSGFPEVDVHKRTTKVNLSIIIGLVIFFAAMFSLVAWFWLNRS